MTSHSIFYYPYASFSEKQSPLLKAAALYFDKLYILDPMKASWDQIGPGRQHNHLMILEQEGVLVRVSPEEVLNKYEEAIAAAIRTDLQNPEFMQLCENSSRAGRWTLALAKIPKKIRDDPMLQPLDQSMKNLMGDVAREVLENLAQYDEIYAEISEVYDETDYREGYKEVVEFRYADFPLPIGEAIMINHALFGGLLHTGATPLTDDEFHKRVLDLKIQQALKLPGVGDELDSRAKQRQFKRDKLAMATLTDIDLAILSPDMPLEEILEFRSDHKDALQEARKELGSLAREIRQQPWSEDFADHLEYESIPAIHRTLEKGKTARDTWLRSEKGRNALQVAGLTFSAASAIITLVVSPTPLLPIAAVTGILGLIGDFVFPGADLAKKWKQGEREAEENGLNYLVRVKEWKKKE